MLRVRRGSQPRLPTKRPSPRAPPRPHRGCAPGWPGSAASQSADPVLEPLFRVVRNTHPKADLASIEKAYKIAEHHHRGQTRNSGDPYITHPLAVTSILAELGHDAADAVRRAAARHGRGHAVHARRSCARDFGDEVALLVDGVTKLDKVKHGDSAQAETIRKMIVAMSKDIRVLVIKLADRLHNMRTLRYLTPGRSRSGSPARRSRSTPRWRTGSA